MSTNIPDRKKKRMKYDAYVSDPLSPSFNNKALSAKKAGYVNPPPNKTPSTMRSPLDRYRGRMLTVAEHNLMQFLMMEIAEDSPDAATKLRVKADVTKFIAERLGRDIYATRQEHTGKNGGAIVAVNISDDEFKSVVETYQSKPTT